MDLSLIDVGSHGELPKPLNGHPFNKVLTFDSKVQTDEPGVIFRNHILWDSCGVREIFLTAGGGHDCFRANTEYVEGLKAIDAAAAQRCIKAMAVIKTEVVECQTLDYVLADLNDQDYDILKIDAQGAEEKILHGAERYLTDHCLCVQAELFSKPMFRGAGLAEDVITYLESLGFATLRKFPAHGSFKCANDYVFVKKDENLKLRYIVEEIYK